MLICSSAAAVQLGGQSCRLPYSSASEARAARPRAAAPWPAQLAALVGLAGLGAGAPLPSAAASLAYTSLQAGPSLRNSAHVAAVCVGRARRLYEQEYPGESTGPPPTLAQVTRWLPGSHTPVPLFHCMPLPSV